MPKGNSFPNSFFSRAAGQHGLTTGDVYWVDSNATNASDGNDGKSPDTPLATLDGAVNKCTANNGDVIVCAENHAETIVADSGVDIDVAGVTVIGLGRGTNRPTFTFTTATTADFKIAAGDVKVENLLFLMGIASQAMVIEVSGDYAEIAHCEFRETASTGSALTAITIGVADGDSDYCHVHDCKFYMDEPGVTNVGNAAISLATDCDNVRIENNWIYGDFDDAGISVPAGGNASDFLVIQGNYVENTAATYAIEVTTGGTMNGGAIVDNRLVSSNAAEILEPHTLQCVGNKGHLGDTGGRDFAVPGTGDQSAGRVVSKSVTFTAAAYEVNTAVTVFTVTGDVFARAWADVTTAVEADAGNDGTISLGIEDSVALLLPVVIANETNFAANDVWAEATTTAAGDKLYNESEFVIVPNGADMEINVLVEDITAGAMTIYVEWFPATAGGSVVAA